MLDIKFIKDNLNETIERLQTRGGDFSYLRETVKKDASRRELIAEVEKLKSERNQKSKEIGVLTKNKKPTETIKEEVRIIGENIKRLDEQIINLEAEIRDELLNTPNLPDPEIPIGLDENDNKEILKFGIPRQFEFKVKDHVDLGAALDILDFERAAKVTGARFVIDK